MPLERNILAEWWSPKTIQPDESVDLIYSAQMPMVLIRIFRAMNLKTLHLESVLIGVTDVTMCTIVPMLPETLWEASPSCKMIRILPGQELKVRIANRGDSVERLAIAAAVDVYRDG
jgi:hypothetical protein